MKFSRGALLGERLTVLNYYLLDGKYSPDVTALRDHAWRFKAGLQYVAQVQIVSGDTVLGTNAESAVLDFAAASANAIRDLLTEAVAKVASKAGKTAAVGPRSEASVFRQEGLNKQEAPL